MNAQISQHAHFGIGYIPHDRCILNELDRSLETYFKSRRDPGFYSFKLNISLKRLNRITDYYYQKTVYQLLQDRLHREASLLLRSTMLSAKEIALDLGVCDAAHFSNWFKKISGMSPLKYRRTFRDPIIRPDQIFEHQRVVKTDQHEYI